MASPRFQQLLGGFLFNENAVFKGEEEKIHHLCEDRIDKSVPLDHHLS